ncbi:glycoside hydrolase [Dipodascopsis uninucleata]
MMLAQFERVWWKEAIVYQIYPASFKDSNNDGLGDIPGIISKLDYIHSLGADTIWLSPIFASPQKDMGYDVSDYRAIHPPYGTIEDVDELITQMLKRGMHLLMDLVVNHTSDQHAWFKESRQSQLSAKRNWYFWRDARYDAHGAWHWDENSKQYYLALFLPSQPDLNWENEDMRHAVYSDMRFWLDKGVDGFRIDSMNLMSKHPDLPGAAITDPTSEFQSAEEWTANGPRIHEFIREMRVEVLDQYPRVLMTVGELAFPKRVEDALAYVAESRHELNMLFTGDVANMDFSPKGKYFQGDFTPRKIREITETWQTKMPECDGWNTVYLENHDSGRSISRYASDEPAHREQSAKMLATYLSSLSGTISLLAGEEIGMKNMPREWAIDYYTDVEGRNFYQHILDLRKGDTTKMDDVLEELKLKARDHGRLPMQWDSSPNAGFTNVSTTPWKELNPDYVEWNVQNQLGDPTSVYNYWKSLLFLRKYFAHIFVYGRYQSIDEVATGEEIVAFRRFGPADSLQEIVVFLNFSANTHNIKTKSILDDSCRWRVLIGSKKINRRQPC